MPCVCDSSVLILLAKAGGLGLLKASFTAVLIPPSVFREVVERGREEGHLEVAAVEAALKEKWLRVQSPRGKGPVLNSLGRGEADSILLAKQTGAMLLIDDASAKAIAMSMGLEAHGTIYVLLRCLGRKELSREGAMRLLNGLVQAGLRLSPEVYAQAFEAMRKM
ncbi:MAG: DUF3368 domain-containing protein [Candidatus Micrarchaeota archaeon]